jgi:hypothetical protein
MSKSGINWWSWHGLPWSGLRPRDRANEGRTTLFAFLWIGSIALIRVPSQLPELPDWGAWPLAALSLWCGWLFARAFHRMLREADELIRMVQLEALGAGFGAGLTCGLTATAIMPAAPWTVLAFLIPMTFAYATRIVLAARQAVKDEER